MVRLGVVVWCGLRCRALLCDVVWLLCLGLYKRCWRGCGVDVVWILLAPPQWLEIGGLTVVLM